MPSAASGSRTSTRRPRATRAGSTRRSSGEPRSSSGSSAAIDAHFDRRRCGIVTSLGPAGIGKSRLAARARRAARRRRARASTGRCLPYGAGITYWPLVELVRDLGGTRRRAGLARRRRTTPRWPSSACARRSAQSDLVGAERRALLGRPAAARGAGAASGRCSSASRTSTGPSRRCSISSSTSARSRRAASSLLCNARPELLETRPGWARYPLFELAQLSDDETHELVGALGDRRTPALADESRRRRRATRCSPSSSPR